MKKTILLAVMMMAVCNVNAQFKVNTSGNAGLKTTPVTNYAFKIDGDGLNGLYINQSGSSSNAYSQYGANIKVTPTSQGLWYYGLFADASSSTTNGWKYGVVGTSSGSSNQNFGVLGYVPSTNERGAAICGTTSGYLTPSTYGLYAGFFDGTVKIDGDLLITGQVSGVVLGTGAPRNISTRIDATTSTTVTEHLCTLNPEIFSLDLPNNELRDEDWAIIEEHSDLVSDNTFKPRELSQIERQIYTKQHYGLNADQLEEVFPDLVYENEDGSKSVNYVEMVPILVQAINELKNELDELKGNGDVKKAQTRVTSSDEMGDNLVMLSLGQNKPNPFGTTTSIDVSIPESVQKAFIYVYDLQGKKIDQVDITARGKQTVQLSAVTLSDGMYLYSLIADGKVVETRRMIVE